MLQLITGATLFHDKTILKCYVFFKYMKLIVGKWFARRQLGG